jgi:NTP pyrophosphatase (non-canonical NTP hydrolase)
MQNNDIYAKAILFFGIESQFEKAEEELAELLLALKHFRSGKCEARSVASEIADVEIMCVQLRILIGNELVDKEKQVKLERLERMMTG